MIKRIRVLSFAITAILLLSSTTAFAQGSSIQPFFDEPNAVSERITYDNNSYGNITNLARGKEKVSDILSHDSSGKSLSNEQLEIIGKSDHATIQTLYYMEKPSDSRDMDSELELINISESEYFQELMRLESESNSDFILLEDEDSGERNYGEFSLDGGMLRMQVILWATDTRITNFRYVAMSAFVWDTMPKQRQTDVFGISRGSNTVSYNGFSSYVETFRATYAGVARFGQPIPLNSTNTLTSSPRNDASNGYHFSIKLNMPVDTPTPHVLEGTWVTIHKHLSMYGEVSFTGGLANLSFIPGGINVINFNHWGTYAHQTKGWTLDTSASVGVEYPSGPTAGFSITANRVSDFRTERVTLASRATIQ